MKNIVIIGASGHSKVIIDILEKLGIWNIIGYIDSFKKDSSFFGYPILGTENELLNITREFNIVGGLIAIGDNLTRFKMVSKIENICPKFKFISAIHPNAILGKAVVIGKGSVIMAGAIVNPDSKIGSHSIINTSSIIEHDSNIGDFSTISPNVAMGGNVNIGNFSTIGIGATLKHGITIEDDVIIGAKSLVLNNIKKNNLAYGIPVKIIRKRKRSDTYL